MRLILKTETFAKLFFLISCSGLLMYTILAFYTFHTAYSSMSQLQKYKEDISGFPILEYKINLEKFKRNLKYILIWTISNEINVIDEGQKIFIENNCRYTNCFLTSNKNYLIDKYTNFEAIVFDTNNIKTWRKPFFPNIRLKKQKYIFYSTKPADTSPICSTLTEDYFNWTWSFRLDSDIFAPFIEVKDMKGNIIAPREVVNWESNMTLLPDEEMKHLKQKKKAVAWIVTKCHTKNDRLLIAKRLQRAFRENMLAFDIFGCEQQECPEEGCLKAIERDYYFYFAPEDVDEKDYVTKEVVLAYKHYAVPIVNGGADYRKFIPDGSYINARTSSMDKLVALVEYTIKNPNIYYSFHRWRKHYIINEAKKFKGICDLCEHLNDENKFKAESVKKDFRTWWYRRPLYEICFPKGAERMEEVLSYVNESRRQAFS